MKSIDHRKVDLHKKIDEILKTRKIDAAFLSSKTMDEILEEISIYHQELEYQNKELMRIQEDLEKSQKYYYSLFNEAPIGYVTFHKDYNIHMTNLAFENMVGLDKLELRDISFARLIKEDYQDAFYFHIRKLLKEQSPQSLELVLKTSGQDIFVKIKSNILKKADLSLIRCAVLDISMEKEAERKLRESEEKFRTIIENSNDIIYALSLQGDLIYVSPNWKGLLGHEVDEVKGYNLAFFIHQEDVNRVLACIHRVAQDNCPIEPVEFRVRHKNGQWRYYETRISLVERDAGHLLLGIARDVTERKKMENALKKEKELLRITLSSVGDGIITTDKNGCITMMNQAAQKLTGWNKGESIKEYLHAAAHIFEDREQISETNKFSFLLKRDAAEKYISCSAAPIKNEQNEIQGLAFVLRDVTEEKKKQEEIEFLSYHDQLTGLYNRRFFEEELKRLDTQRNLPLSVVMADVNGLKLTNDAFGYKMGDKLLKKAAEVIKNECRSDEIVARLGGDEFVILLPKTSQETAEKIVDRIKQSISNIRMEFTGLSVSFGWYTKVSTHEDVSETLKNAEDLLFRHKLFESPSIRGKTIRTIISTLHEKNKREELHSQRVSYLCEAMGVAMQLSSREIKELKTVGLLHDIGKVSIDDNVLNKVDSLTQDERNELKRHPEIGYRILSSANDMSEIAEFVLAHHENYDGSGYPKGLKGDEIPLQARIIRIVDAYDAMTNNRTYGSILDKEKVIIELEEGAGTKYDAGLVSIFIKQVLKNLELIKNLNGKTSQNV